MPPGACTQVCPFENSGTSQCKRWSARERRWLSVRHGSGTGVCFLPGSVSGCGVRGNAGVVLGGICFVREESPFHVDADGTSQRVRHPLG